MARGILLLSALCLCAALVAGSAGAARAPVRATLVGDSIAASLTYVASARTKLSRGMKVRLDAKVCRRLVQPSCTYGGSRPSTALQAVQGYGRSLGQVLVVNVGYNESSAGYRTGIDRIMRSALSQGAKGVVWVTLRETRSVYTGTNQVIRKAAKRWRQMEVADWNAYSRGKAWFASDGLHLTATGARALATLIRVHVLKVARSAT